MSTLAGSTNPGLIVPQLRCRDAAGVVAELCSTLQRQGLIGDSLAFYHAVMSREALSSTAIAPGWALPHARLRSLPRLSYAVGRTVEPLRWFGREADPVQLVFLFTVPDAQAAAYITLVAGLGKLSQDPALIERLLRAPDSESIFAVLDQVQLRPPRAAAVAV